VDALGFEVPEGTVFGLLGPNGAGKTTTIRLVLHLVSADAGSAVLLDRRLGSSGYHGSLREVGALIEGPALYGRLRGRRNLEIHARYLGIPDARARIDELLGLVGLYDAAEQRVRTYSLGMKQRLGLAIALLGRPRLLILDEPTNGLDPAGIAEFRDLVRSFPEMGTTVLLSSHLLGEVEQACDHVGIIHLGRMITTGRTADVVAAAGETAATSYIVELDPADRDGAWAILAGAGLATGAIDERTLEVSHCPDGRWLSWTLAHNGIYPEQLTRRRRSLEDAFLRLTQPRS